MKQMQFSEEFYEGLQILISEKPKDAILTKAVEEFLELALKLIQCQTKPGTVSTYDIKEEIVDCSMHLLLLRSMWEDDPEIIHLKEDKFLHSADFHEYKTKYLSK